MIQIKVDEQKLEELYLQEIQKRLEKIEAKTLFWDRKELMKQTKMGWNAILENFFYHPDFPKQKIGSKWYFPAAKTEAFLTNWLEENPKYKKLRKDT